jgi:hypothetical protein
MLPAAEALRNAIARGRPPMLYAGPALCNRRVNPMSLPTSMVTSAAGICAVIGEDEGFRMQKIWTAGSTQKKPEHAASKELREHLRKCKPRKTEGPEEPERADATGAQG